MTKETVKKETVNLIVSATSTKLDKTFLSLEREIRTANKSFLIIGKNLTIISEGQLYKQRGFNTFELYVQTMFDFTRDNAYKIMAATRVYNVLQQNFKPSELPTAETHCRPLTKIEKDEDVITIWSKVVKTNKIIAKTVIGFVDQFLGKETITKEKKKPEIEIITEESNGKTLQKEVTQEGTDWKQKALQLQAEVTKLENQLQKVRESSKGIAGTKMARTMIQAGFAAMAASCTEDQKAELIATKKALLG